MPAQKPKIHILYFVKISKKFIGQLMIMQNNNVKGFATHLDDSKAISYCESLISAETYQPINI